MSLIDVAENTSVAAAIAGFFARRSFGVSSFMPPANRYAVASNPDAIHIAMFT
jgi:hypothetical protein